MAELIHRISWLPYKGKDPAEITGKSRDLALTEAMKKKYKFGKKKRGYIISSIKDKGVCVATQLLAGKVMRKCHRDKVLVLVVALVEQCTKEVQFNQVEFLCEEFLTNYKEAQEKGKTFDYVWLLFSILLVTGELPKDSQFPHIEQLARGYKTCVTLGYEGCHENP